MTAASAGCSGWDHCCSKFFASATAHSHWAAALRRTGCLPSACKRFCAQQAVCPDQEVTDQDGIYTCRHLFCNLLLQRVCAPLLQLLLVRRCCCCSSHQRFCPSAARAGRWRVRLGCTTSGSALPPACLRVQLHREHVWLLASPSGLHEEVWLAVGVPAVHGMDAGCRCLARPSKPTKMRVALSGVPLRLRAGGRLWAQFVWRW